MSSQVYAMIYESLLNEKPYVGIIIFFLVPTTIPFHENYILTR